MQLVVTVTLNLPTGTETFTLNAAVSPPGLTQAQYLDYWLALVRTEFAKAPVSAA